MSKFSSTLAEDLHELTLDSFQEDETGSTETIGWHALFTEERAILGIDNSGFVWATQFDTREELDAEWAALVRRAGVQADIQNLSQSCDGLFLIVDTANHIGAFVDPEEIREHIADCEECLEVNYDF